MYSLFCGSKQQCVSDGCFGNAALRGGIFVFRFQYIFSCPHDGIWEGILFGNDHFFQVICFSAFIPEGFAWMLGNPGNLACGTYVRVFDVTDIGGLYDFYEKGRLFKSCICSR